MKKIFCIVAIVIFSAQAFCQSQRGLELSLGGGIPLVNMQYWRLEYNTGAGLAYPLSSRLTIFASGDYNKFTVDPALFGSENTAQYAGGSSKRITSGLIGVKISLDSVSQRVIPYVIGGIGYSHSVEDSLYLRHINTFVVGGSSKNFLSFVASLGVDIATWNNLMTFLECRVGRGFGEASYPGVLVLRAGIRAGL